RTGQPAVALTKGDFDLYEDGVRQEIAFFSKDQLPLSVVLLSDVSLSTRKPQIRDGALRALQRLKPDDEVAFMTFSFYARVIEGLTTNKELVSKRIGDYFAGLVEDPPLPKELEDLGPDGTHIGDSIYQTSEYLSKFRKPGSRSVIIVITDNWPWE